MSHLIPFLVLVFFYTFRNCLLLFSAALGLLYLWRARETACCSGWVSRCGGFFCEAPAPGLVDVSSCGSWAYLPRGMWDLPRPGIESVSSVLTGRFLITGLPGKSRDYLFCTLSSIAKHLQLSSTINSQK